MVQRYDRLKDIQRLDPERDFLEIYRLTVSYEFPWDITRALELASTAPMPCPASADSSMRQHS